MKKKKTVQCIYLVKYKKGIMCPLNEEKWRLMQRSGNLVLHSADKFNYRKSKVSH